MAQSHRAMGGKAQPQVDGPLASGSIPGDLVLSISHSSFAPTQYCTTFKTTQGRAAAKGNLCRPFFVHSAVPPRVEHELTPLGLSLGGAFCGVWIWAEANLKAVEKARSQFDQKTSPLQNSEPTTVNCELRTVNQEHRHPFRRAAFPAPFASHYSSITQMGGVDVEPLHAPHPETNEVKL